jgi:hypothetical protein
MRRSEREQARRSSRWGLAADLANAIGTDHADARSIRAELARRPGAAWPTLRAFRGSFAAFCAFCTRSCATCRLGALGGDSSVLVTLDVVIAFIAIAIAIAIVVVAIAAIIVVVVVVVVVAIIVVVAIVVVAIVVVVVVVVVSAGVLVVGASGGGQLLVFIDLIALVGVDHEATPAFVAPIRRSTAADLAGALGTDQANAVAVGAELSLVPVAHSPPSAA